MAIVETRPAPLSDLQNNPTRLIPSQFFDSSLNPDKLTAVSLRLWLGRMDQEYIPSLHTLIVQQEAFEEPTEDQEEDDDPVWDFALNEQRKSAISLGKISNRDMVLTSIIAQQQSHRVVFCDQIILHSTIRGKHLGSSLLTHFENMLREGKYEFVYGDSTTKAYNFYLRHGWKDLSKAPDRSLFPELVFSKGVFKILNPNPES